MLKVSSAVAALAFALVVPMRADDAVTKCWEEIRLSTGDPPSCLAEQAVALVPRVLSPLEPLERTRLGSALASAVMRDLDASAELTPSGEKPGAVRYRVIVAEEARDLVLVLGDDDALSDVLWDGRSIVDRYRELSGRLVSRYSFEYLVAELEGGGTIALEDFEAAPIGELPHGWKRRPFGADDGSNPYTVREESGNRFLRAEDRGENVMLYKEVKWNARKYPYFGWRWRIRAVPRDADERVDERADSAAGVYLTYRRRLGLVPETVKFVWSGRHPKGTLFRRPGMGMPWTLVAGSGEADERWQRVVYRIADVYEKTFGGDAGERPLGIAVLSDANETRSFAAADYDDFVALTSSDGLW
ncbi:MAG TPA: DUF3047 domain-containing protein [Vicinamibacteria bacterium]|nr:DUF3047 domain-containing protein [Vicinamibacteria bacterium]